jgi:hypothetical protein
MNKHQRNLLEATELPLLYPEPIERIRALVRFFSSHSESWNSQWSISELVAIHDAYQRSEWLIEPRLWTDRQIREALLGIAPNWEDGDASSNDLKPVYSTKAAK